MPRNGRSAVREAQPGDANVPDFVRPERTRIGQSPTVPHRRSQNTRAPGTGAPGPPGGGPPDNGPPPFGQPGLNAASSETFVFGAPGPGPAPSLGRLRESMVITAVHSMQDEDGVVYEYIQIQGQEGIWYTFNGRDGTLRVVEGEELAALEEDIKAGPKEVDPSSTLQPSSGRPSPRS
jgi:hypothetical protein